MRVEQVRLDVGPAVLSGLVGTPDGAPRGLVLALHGGGSRAAYWDSPVDPAASFVQTAAAAGWLVLAVDRPGYGASNGLAGGRTSAAYQVPLLETAVSQVRPPGLPVVLVGHSLGGIVGVHMAAQGCPPGLAALAIGGVPLRYTDQQRATMPPVDHRGVVGRRPPGTRPDPDDWYGPAGSWDRRLLDHRPTLLSPTPPGEYLDAYDAPVALPPLLARIEVPVQVAAAGHELTTAPGAEILSIARTALTAAPRVETVLVERSGHNLSLGGMARSYHLRVLTFAELAVAEADLRR